MADYIGALLVLLAMWGLSYTQLLVLQRRGLNREFWVTVSLLLVATAGTLITALGSPSPFIVPVLTRWLRI